MEAATLEAAILCFLCEVGKLKLTEREGWKRTIPNPECVAAHSHRMALMTMLIPDDRGLDKFKCIKMAVVHDLAESIIGDVPSFAELPKKIKYAMELMGFKYLTSLLKPHAHDLAQHLLELWLEYERDETEEAKAVREIDKTECLIQAWQYERSTFGEKDLEEFQGLRKKIHSKEGKALVEALSQERERDCARRAQRLPILFIMGDSAISEEVAKSVSSCLDLPHISVNKIACEWGKDPTSKYYEVIRDCLEHGFDLPAGLLVELIKCELAKAGDRGDERWTIISGFKNKEQVTDFDEKIQHLNHAIWVESTLSTDHPMPKASELDEAMQRWRPPAAIFKETLKSITRFQELTLPVPGTALCKMTRILVESIIQGNKASLWVKNVTVESD